MTIEERVDAVEAAPDAAAEATLRTWTARFGAAANEGDEAALGELFLPDGYWRDLVACTWSVSTFHGARDIGSALAALPEDLRPRRVAVEARTPVESVDREGWGPTIEGFLSFTTGFAVCRGHVKLLRDELSGEWRAWTLLTSVEQFPGHEEQIGPLRPLGYPEGHLAGRTWFEERRHERSYVDREPAVIVVGGGHSGLAVAARLKVLGVDVLVVERNERIGDNWRNRYRSLYLHNEVWSNHMPYVAYPPTWPVFTSKDKLADWLEGYVDTLDLNVWTGVEVRGASYDDSEQTWAVELHTRDGSKRVLRPRHVILAPGVFGEARTLEFRGQDSFGGDIVRSQDFTSDEEAVGRRVLVVGTGSSAHDIARDYQERGASVTMLQRSSTTVVSVDPGVRLSHSLYKEGGRPVADCDLISASTPLPLLRQMHTFLYKRVAALDRELIAGLNRAGFRTDYGDDGSGHLMKYYERGGGYYIDVGCSQLIVDGKVAVKNGVEIDHLEPGRAVFTDGSHLECDVIVLAVGFGNMQTVVARIFGGEVADRVGPVWGLDVDGELRAMYRPTGQNGLWIMGGSFVQCRIMSRVLAQQILAREVGLPVKLPFAVAARPA